MSTATKGRAPSTRNIRAQAARMVALSMSALVEVAQSAQAAPADRVGAVRLLTELAAGSKDAIKDGGRNE